MTYRTLSLLLLVTLYAISLQSGGGFSKPKSPAPESQIAEARQGTYPASVYNTWGTDTASSDDDDDLVKEQAEQKQKEQREKDAAAARRAKASRDAGGCYGGCK